MDVCLPSDFCTTRDDWRDSPASDAASNDQWLGAEALVDSALFACTEHACAARDRAQQRATRRRPRDVDPTWQVV